MDKGSLAPAQTLTAHGGSMHKKMSGKNSEKKLAGTAEQSNSAVTMFITMALNMSWQLAVVVLVPIIAGVQLDKSLDSGNLFLFVGLGLAAIGSAAVMWRSMQAANRLPVPKLTDDQKRAIKKSYEEEDKDD